MFREFVPSASLNKPRLVNTWIGSLDLQYQNWADNIKIRITTILKCMRQTWAASDVTKQRLGYGLECWNFGFTSVIGFGSDVCKLFDFGNIMQYSPVQRARMLRLVSANSYEQRTSQQSLLNMQDFRIILNSKFGRKFMENKSVTQLNCWCEKSEFPYSVSVFFLSNKSE